MEELTEQERIEAERKRVRKTIARIYKPHKGNAIVKNIKVPKSRAGRRKTNSKKFNVYRRI
jgi:uncharacterized protein (UPF0335 family)